MTITSNAKNEGRARAVMPLTAAWVDQMRQGLGAAWVDGAIAAGQRARREHGAIAASQGLHAADAWLSRQSFQDGCFWAEESGHSVGVQRP